MNGERTSAVIRALEIGAAMAASTQAYFADLAARQKAREAEGRELTDADLDELLDQTSATIASARARINGTAE
ncbi:MAG: hypothetical protein GC151_13815 [Betaproteobacteria bacterium]|nr:hypothetical protein [Betaproteobacteria bacterium]